MASTLPVAIITGTNSGLGLAMTVSLAATHKVYAGMRGLSDTKRAALDSAVAAAGLTQMVSVIDLDVNSNESVESAVNKAIEESGRCDILVNNAGYSVFGSVEMVSMETMHSQLNTNVLGVIRCTKAVLPTMRKQKSGKIINISSVGGVWGQPFNDIYCASKFALEGLAESQAPLFRTFGVTVSSVQPGAITSEFINNAAKPDPASIPPEYMPGIQSTMAVYSAVRENAGNSQTPEEVAQIIMDQVVKADNPPVKVQTNPKIQAIFEMQLKDTSGESGVVAGTARFLTPNGSAPAAAEKDAKITLYYWPLMGRTLGMTFLLEDSGVAYKRVNYMGGPLPDPSIVAVPCVEVSGTFVSQTLAILDFLGDELGYLPPARVRNKSLQCMHTIQDIVEQATGHRATIKTRAEAAGYVNSRVAQFFTAIEANFKDNRGSYFFGETPCQLDFHLLASVIQLRLAFGDELINDMLKAAAPTVLGAAELVAARPRVKALIDAKYNGAPLFPPSMKAEASLLTE